MPAMKTPAGYVEEFRREGPCGLAVHFSGNGLRGAYGLAADGYTPVLRLSTDQFRPVAQGETETLFEEIFGSAPGVTEVLRRATVSAGPAPNPVR